MTTACIVSERREGNLCHIRTRPPRDDRPMRFVAMRFVAMRGDVSSLNFVPAAGKAARLSVSQDGTVHDRPVFHHGAMTRTPTVDTAGDPLGPRRPSDPLAASEKFRSIMSAFPTGVTVITTTDGSGEFRGFTSNAVTSVSLDPPLLLVCVAHTSETLPALRESRRFVVNFLKSDEDEISNRFARKGPGKFDSATFYLCDGLPVLDGHNIAYAVCSTESEIEAGDHIILVGRVLEGEVIADHARPLLYYRSRYPSWPAA